MVVLLCVTFSELFKPQSIIYLMEKKSFCYDILLFVVSNKMNQTAGQIMLITLLQSTDGR